MIDLHSHFIYGIDDGARTIEESIEIIEKLNNNGVTDVVATPHYILGSTYSSNNKEKMDRLFDIKKIINEKNLPINLYLGNEAFVDNKLDELIKSKEIYTINDTKYLLFELSFTNEYNGLEDLIFKLQSFGYKPIIAHPERYTYVIKNPNLVNDLISRGCLFQSNVGSFFGKYGDSVKKTVNLLMKHHCIHFLGTDIHRSNSDDFKNIRKVEDILKENLDINEVDDILENNAKHVFKNENIDIIEPIPFKKNLFGNYK